MKREGLRRQLTGKYDMFVLKQINRTEEAAIAELVQMYKVESEDDLPVSFDIHQLVDMPHEDRRDYLTSLLKGCPSDDSVQAFMDKYLDTVKELNPHLK